MITFSDSQQKMVNELEAVNRAHWIDNHNGTISCSYCSTWFYKDDRYSYMDYCPYCGKKMEDKQAIDTTVKDEIGFKAIKGADLVEIKTILADFEKATNRLSSYVNRASNDNFIWNSEQNKEVNTIEIPKNATNGDMIKAMFPDSEIKEIRGTFKGDLLGYRTYLGGRSQDFLLDWWNAPFKRGDKTESEGEE